MTRHSVVGGDGGGDDDEASAIMVESHRWSVAHSTEPVICV